MRIQDILSKAFNKGHFAALDKLFVYALNSLTKINLYLDSLFSPNFFKYLMHFNLYYSQDLSFLKTEAINNSILLGYIKKINFLNSLDEKTRYFMLKYIQAFDNKILEPWDEQLKEKIIILNQAIVSNKPDYILSSAATLGVVLNVIKIAEFIKEAEKIHGIVQLEEQRSVLGDW
jgi:hypothetical protein